jgi:Luciferase-like monooxygenase
VSHYGRELEFGVSVVPTVATVADARQAAEAADRLGIDLIGIQDHPYQWRFLETWALIADLLARTERLRAFPDVANLPLRGPAMIASTRPRSTSSPADASSWASAPVRSGRRSERWEARCGRQAKPWRRSRKRST